MNKRTSLLFVTLFIIAGVISRFLPHPPNFTAVGAISLFGAAYYSNKKLSLIVPLAIFWLSDLFLNNVIYAEYYQGFQWYGNAFVYLGIIGVVGIGHLLLKKVNFGNVVLSAVSAAVVFFLLTNFGTWYTMGIYTKDTAGLITAFEAGIPFFRVSLLANLVFSAVMFGSYEFIFNRNKEVATA